MELPDQLLTVREVAQRLRVCPATVYKICASGELVHVRISNAIRVAPDDLIYYGNPGQLEHDFIVAPGANPKAIRLSIRGATKARIDSDSDLLLSISGGMVCLHRPRIYQDVDGVRQPIIGRYVVKGENRFGFEIDKYDVPVVCRV